MFARSPAIARRYRTAPATENVLLRVRELTADSLALETTGADHRGLTRWGFQQGVRLGWSALRIASGTCKAESATEISLRTSGDGLSRLRSIPR